VTEKKASIEVITDPNMPRDCVYFMPGSVSQRNTNRMFIHPNPKVWAEPTGLAAVSRSLRRKWWRIEAYFRNLWRALLNRIDEDD
jgi:hypothetical protein